MCCHPLEQHSCRRLRRNLVGDRHQHFLRHCGKLGIDADHRSGIGHPVAFPNSLDAGAHTNHLPGGLNARNERQLDRVGHAGTVLGVNKVDRHCLVAHQDLARSRDRRGNLNPAEHLRATMHVDPHREHPRHSQRSVTATPPPKPEPSKLIRETAVHQPLTAPCAADRPVGTRTSMCR